MSISNFPLLLVVAKMGAGGTASLPQTHTNVTRDGAPMKRLPHEMLPFLVKKTRVWKTVHFLVVLTSQPLQDFYLVLPLIFAYKAGAFVLGINWLISSDNYHNMVTERTCMYLSSDRNGCWCWYRNRRSVSTRKTSHRRTTNGKSFINPFYYQW